MVFMGVISLVHPNLLVEKVHFMEESVVEFVKFRRDVNDLLAMVQITVIFWDVLKYFLIFGRRKNNKWKVGLTRSS